MSPSLYLVANPFPGEAPSSWIFRTAALHDVSVGVLLSAVNVRRRRQDLDLSFHEKFVRQVVRGTGLAWNDVKIMARHFAPFRQERWLGAWLRKTVSNKPGMAYCPSCLASDVVPYWRSVWRFRYWVLCPVHQCRVLDRCSTCMSEFALEDDFNIRSGDLVTSWIVCQCCGASRVKANADRWRDDGGHTNGIVELQRGVTSALLHGYFALAGFPQEIPLALLPGVLNAGAYCTEADAMPFHDVRHRKELESAIRYHKRSGFEGLQPRTPPGQYMTTYRVPWIGDASELAEKVLYKRFIIPAAD